MTPTIPDLAILAIIAACWRQIRTLFDRFRGLFVQRIALRSDIARIVSYYLYSEGRIFSLGDQGISSDNAYIRPLDRKGVVARIEAPTQPVLAMIPIRGRKEFIIIRKAKESYAAGGGDAQPDDNRLFLHTRRGLDVKALTADAIEWAHQRETTGKRYRVFPVAGAIRRSSHHPGELPSEQPPSGIAHLKTQRLLHWSIDDIGEPQPKNPFLDYVTCPESEAARKDFQAWRQRKRWYLDRGIPWRRGHLYYGPPGSGKTALIRALAQESDMPIFAFDLATFGNAEFLERWNHIQSDAPCIALIEDIDTVFEGRKNVTQASAMADTLSFDCLLNALGGASTADGVFIAITTNRPETLDEALGRPLEEGGSQTSRPGRLDRAYRLDVATDSQRSAIIRRICGEGDWSDAIAETRGRPASHVTEWAIQHALKTLWELGTGIDS